MNERIEYVEYYEDSGKEISHHDFDIKDLRIEEGEKSKTLLIEGNTLVSFVGIEDGKIHLILYNEVYEYSYRVVAEALLDEANPVCEGRREQNRESRWINYRFKLI